MEDIIVTEQDQEYYPMEYIDTDDVCPDDGTPLRMHYEGNGEDDYRQVWECPKCGLTETE